MSGLIVYSRMPTIKRNQPRKRQTRKRPSRIRPVLSGGSPPDIFVFNNKTLRRAVNLWKKNEDAAFQRFGHISDWDTSQVTDMNALFYKFETFNEPLHWDTRNVTNMSFMFFAVKSFNQPLSFDTQNVTNMGFMFCGAISFNQPLSFVTSNVTVMRLMFYKAARFDQPLDFDLRKVNLEHADSMLEGTAIERRFGITTLKNIPPDHPYMIWASKARNWNRRKNYVKTLSESGFLDGTSRRRHPALSLAAHKTLESKDLSRHIGRFL